ncbi:hypothetical protein B0T17DRAFT_67077 [Bombardia bombarda]|uniref:Uncharacterized protein n=1 Tax=Bombardia bombarda TaxID=252184 RepID=A0AA40CEZ8_9PEZI|nr:hypothetical protein B0T17DRAFT_67077 [Bombardia bombarda]
MSWTHVIAPYQLFETEAIKSVGVQSPSQWSMNIWEVTNDFPHGRTPFFEIHPEYLRTKAALRIVFTSLDLPLRESAPQLVRLCDALSIPPEFLAERLQSVSHSFGSRTDQHGFCTWFHFLCKNIELKLDVMGRKVIDNRAPKHGQHSRSLPMADYTWQRSGFFLRKDNEGNLTLVCFGATPKVRKRLDALIEAGAWRDIMTEPYILFDLILDGLFVEVDNTVWSMNDVFGPLEHRILDVADKENMRKVSNKINFAELHNCAKHIIHIHEAVDSCILVVDGTLSRLNDDNTQPNPHPLILKQLHETLQYRRSLFKSTKLRLGSLQKRIDNAINLSFNLVTQQDSMLMIQDSTSMKIISVITMFFLPTTGVATIIGSQLFVATLNDPSNQAGGGWDIATSPLFLTMWYIAVPLTCLVVLFAAFFQCIQTKKVYVLRNMFLLIGY